ncbi:MAG: beta-hydroxyacyl-ACP dehydratase [Betaproteobacteria bacterium]
MNTIFPAIEEVLPHRGTMRLLDEVTAFTSEAATCAYTVDGTAWYAESFGGMPAWIGIELMAQTVAAHVSLLARREGRPVRPGALLGTRSFNSRRAAFAHGERLSVSVRLEFRDDTGLGVYECEIAVDETVVADAALKVFEPDDFDQFLAAGRNPS